MKTSLCVKLLTIKDELKIRKQLPQEEGEKDFLQSGKNHIQVRLLISNTSEWTTAKFWRKTLLKSLFYFQLSNDIF